MEQTPRVGTRDRTPEARPSWPTAPVEAPTAFAWAPHVRVDTLAVGVSTKDSPDGARDRFASDDLGGDRLDHAENVMRPLVKRPDTVMLPNQVAQEKVPEGAIQVRLERRIRRGYPPNIECDDAADTCGIDVVRASPGQRPVQHRYYGLLVGVAACNVDPDAMACETAERIVRGDERTQPVLALRSHRRPDLLKLH